MQQKLSDEFGHGRKQTVAGVGLLVRRTDKVGRERKYYVGMAELLRKQAD